ncbi:MAG: hypothetical protein BRC40_16695 [Cyanobacteria bacterium QH_8_48_120]|jgi:uncharacterized membrane protein|nr:MAG: hypothetical protein BRC34_10840 [Cyanobacteria bacterium QH_1_48_107]PSO62534.1 MAG: hypothetical protein BRC38_15445 [Cyanobacteria bacterium QH_6_48_35]PSO68747.1 MAG: hypothetical protein BRC40_16695 [Cyanobacteria bacterium QH_8_48_120]
MSQDIKAEKTFTINKSPEELYRYWRNFENVPNFMNDINYVKVLDNNRLEWSANVPMGSSVEWEAEIIEDKENESIAWESVEGAAVNQSARASFYPASDGNGTEVKFVSDYKPPGGAVGAGIGKLLSSVPQKQVEDALNQLKTIMEQK